MATSASGTSCVSSPGRSSRRRSCLPAASRRGRPRRIPGASRFSYCFSCPACPPSDRSRRPRARRAATRA
jgi:hypothetical protein